jgi:hypothetical protein
MLNVLPSNCQARLFFPTPVGYPRQSKRIMEKPPCIPYYELGNMQYKYHSNQSRRMIIYPWAILERRDYKSHMNRTITKAVIANLTLGNAHQAMETILLRRCTNAIPETASRPKTISSCNSRTSPPEYCAYPFANSDSYGKFRGSNSGKMSWTFQEQSMHAAAYAGKTSESTGFLIISGRIEQVLKYSYVPECISARHAIARSMRHMRIFA